MQSRNLHSRTFRLQPAALAALLALGSLPARALHGPPRSPQKIVSAVESKDGTRIAYEQTGHGPALILVSPALADRSASAPLAKLLEPSFTVIHYDRRGRRDSGDMQPYAVEREIEDLEALIDVAGGKAALFGSSSGAVLALEAANALGSKVSAAILFEPPFIVDDSRDPIPEDFAPRIEAHLAEGRRGDAVAHFMTVGVGVPEGMLAGMRQSPMWAAMERSAHTLPYDCELLAGLQAGTPLPADRWTAVSARVLVLEGENSPPYLKSAASALAERQSGAKIETLAGQDHSAVFIAPQSLVPHVVKFLSGSAQPSGAGKQVEAGAKRP
jgi:pimeloyl-ACP methyl ester carboxylesterase